jgi:hypothetical protein
MPENQSFYGILQKRVVWASLVALSSASHSGYNFTVDATRLFRLGYFHKMFTYMYMYMYQYTMYTVNVRDEHSSKKSDQIEPTSVHGRPAVQRWGSDSQHSGRHHNCRHHCLGNWKEEIFQVNGEYCVPYWAHLDCQIPYIYQFWSLCCHSRRVEDYAAAFGSLLTNSVEDHTWNKEKRWS